jgi:uncharacterized protein (TIGR00251 family)
MTNVVVDIRVIPRAKKTELAGVREGAVLIRLAAPPVEGAANETLVAFLATLLDLPRRNIRIISGEHARHKRVSIAGAAADAVRSRLGI